MSERTGYEGRWPPRPVTSVRAGQVVQFLEPGTGRILTGTVVVPTWGPWKAAYLRLENGKYTWAWVHELSEKENDEHTS